MFNFVFKFFVSFQVAEEDSVVRRESPDPELQPAELKATEPEPDSGSSKDVFLENDIGKWPKLMTSADVDYCIKIGVTALQNCDSGIIERKSFVQFDSGKGSDKSFKRKCQASFFVRKAKNGDVIKRSWLCFSPSNGKVYCYVCKLFSTVHSHFTDDGFCDWKNATSRLIDHETSKAHLNAVIVFAGRVKEIGQIDQELTRQAEDVAKYWREVLRRLISVIVFISERGLAIRGENETLGSPKNGNYLGILELVAQYDEFLRDHIKGHGNRGSGHTNYLSSTICEEVLKIIGKQVFNEIISRIKKSKYYSISLDSTADEGHIDQLSLVLRYLEESTPVERFVTFMPNQGHKAKDMFQSLITFLEENGLDIKNCRGQSYDNASSMSGKYNGLQALVRQENDLALWVPCAGHSLNLVVQAAAGCCLSAVSFFDFLEELFVFFTSSTSRYKTLTDCLQKAKSRSEKRENPFLVPKRTTTTRWSCRADATKALLHGYTEIQNTLFGISDDKEEPGKARVQALGLFKKMKKMETRLYIVFWNDILGQVSKTSETLQNPRLDINTAASLLSSLKSLIESKRDSYEEYEERASGLAKGEVDSEKYEEKRKRKTNVRLATLDSAQAPEVELTPSSMFRTGSFIPVIDELERELHKRLQAYQQVDERFGFLSKLHELSLEEVQVASKKLVDLYHNDLEDDLGNELVQFKIFSDQYRDEYEKNKKVLSKERWLYKMLLDNNLKDCLPNVEVTLRLYLSLMVTNCSAERSFSKLKLIKNRLRTTMTEDRLNFLSLLSIENDILKQVNYDDVISTFIDLKLRKKPISST